MNTTNQQAIQFCIQIRMFSLESRMTHIGIGWDTLYTYTYITLYDMVNLVNIVLFS